MINKKSPNLNLRQKAHEGVDSVIDKANNINVNRKKQTNNLKEKIYHIWDGIDNYIEEKPKKSVLIATLIGSIVTIMIIKRKK